MGRLGAFWSISSALLIMISCGSPQSAKEAASTPTSAEQNAEPDDSSAPGMTLADGAEVVNDFTVAVTLRPPEGSRALILTDRPDFSGVPTQAVVTSTEWTFASDGKQTLFAVFFDDSGSEPGAFVDSIVIDIFAGEPLSVTFPLELSLSRTVAMQLQFPAQATAVQLDEDEEFSTAIWIPVSDRPETYNFSSTGRHRLYFRVQNQQEYVSQATSAEILIEPFEPDSGALEINGGAESTTDSNLSFLSLIYISEPTRPY